MMSLARILALWGLLLSVAACRHASPTAVDNSHPARVVANNIADVDAIHEAFRMGRYKEAVVLVRHDLGDDVEERVLGLFAGEGGKQVVPSNDPVILGEVEHYRYLVGPELRIVIDAFGGGMDRVSAVLWSAGIEHVWDVGNSAMLMVFPSAEANARALLKSSGFEIVPAADDRGRDEQTSPR